MADQGALRRSVKQALEELIGKTQSSLPRSGHYVGGYLIEEYHEPDLYHEFGDPGFGRTNDEPERVERNGHD